YDVYEYSRKGDLESLREALDGGSKPDEYMAYDGSTALVMAARSGHSHIVKELLARGGDPQVRTEDGSTLLHHAASGNSPEAIHLLIEKRIDPNALNEDGVAPLILAAHYGHLSCVSALCNGGADVNLSAEGWGTPLDGADGEVAKFLESKGAKRSAGGVDQPLAAAHERFSYGCFETGENPHATPVLAPGGKSEAKGRKPKVGDCVRLGFAKPSGLLKEGDVGVVVADDGSDCVPLKVSFGERYDYYEYADLVVCEPAEELPPDSAHATADGTKRFLVRKKLEMSNVRALGLTGLHISPVGFGCHRLEDVDAHKAALELAVSLGCNFVDLAPNYTDGVAEEVAGEILQKMLQSRKVRRDEIIVATKVGNVLGKQLAFAEGVPNMTKINDSLFHCISPAWIEQELTRSLNRLQLSCIDCLLLHCPEYETKAAGVSMADVYNRMRAAFEYLETEVARGRIVCYGVSAAFMPLRPTDAEHLDLSKVMLQLPANHHFRVLQFPLNFAEAEAMWVGHVPRNPDGSAVNSNSAVEAPNLFEAAKSHGLATLINRPLDGIYKEAHGVLRFSSLDCDVRSYSELQLDNCDALEQKITTMCKLSEPPFNADDGAAGQLAAKTVKVLAGLQSVDCVLLGMRQPEYVVGTLPLLFGTPSVSPQ
ncbi:RFXANK, partial [Symbiodinium pilosum]